jgi:protein involved in polysaccharide export with SLBB domain
VAGVHRPRYGELLSQLVRIAISESKYEAYMKWFCALPFAMLVGIAGCADRAVAPYPTSPPLNSDGGAVLGTGDIIEVIVAGEPDLSHPYQVDDDGTVNFPMIGRVAVVGKTKRQIEDDISVRLKDGYLRNPQVTVIIKEVRSKRVSVFGQVKTPGTFSFTPNMSVVEAITLAGGFTSLAKKNSVRVTRLGSEKAFIVAVQDIGEGKAPNFFLRPGDVIFVAERLL